MNFNIFSFLVLLLIKFSLTFKEWWEDSKVINKFNF